MTEERLIKIVFFAFFALIGQVIMWRRNAKKKRKSVKHRSITQLMEHLVRDEYFERNAGDDNKVAPPVVHYSLNKYRIDCVYRSKCFAALNSDVQALLLNDALDVTGVNNEFVNKILDSTNWPEGVEYFVGYTPFDQTTRYIGIKIYVELDWEDDPEDDLLGYISYLNDLQLNLLKEFNTYKAGTKTSEDPNPMFVRM